MLGMHVLALVPMSRILAPTDAEIAALMDLALYDMTDPANMTVERDGSGGAPADTDPVGRILDISGADRHATANSDSTRGTRDGSTLLTNGVDDVYTISSAIPNTAQYIFAVVAIKVTSTAWAPIIDEASGAIGIRRYGSGGTGQNYQPTSQATSFALADGVQQVNGVTTAAFVYDEMHVVEYTRGSTAPTNTMSRLFGNSSTGRYLNGNIAALGVTTTIPSAAQRARIRQWGAAKGGFTL